MSAAEIGCWVNCLEQWQLQYGLGLPPENRQALAVGDRHHARKAMAERIAGGSIGLGRVLVIDALGVLLLLWLVWR